jgi:hypothetical protein
MHTEFWSRNLKERDKLEGLGIDESNIKMALNDVADDRDSWWAFFLRGNEIAGSIHCGEYLDYPVLSGVLVG